MSIKYKGQTVSGGGISGIPSGVIFLWSGSQATIPTGYALCDGSNGTPDLRDRFVLGAGTTHEVGETGGSEEVTLTTAQMPSHMHTVRLYNATKTQDTSAASLGAASGELHGTNDVHWINSASLNTTGASSPHPNMPPYYTLCYIMKL